MVSNVSTGNVQVLILRICTLDTRLISMLVVIESS